MKNALTANAVRTIGNELDEVISSIGDKYGLKVRRSRIVRSEKGFTLNLTAAVANAMQTLKAKAKAEAEEEVSVPPSRQSYRYKFKHSELGQKHPELLGAPVDYHGVTYKVIGLTSTRPDARLVVRSGRKTRMLSQSQLNEM